MKNIKITKPILYAVCAVLAVLLIILAGFGIKKAVESSNTVKTTLSQSEKKHIVVAYPLSVEEAANAYVTLKNLETEEILIDNTFESGISAYSFLTEGTGKYLITLYYENNIEREHIVELNDQNSFYYIRMQNS